MVAQSNLARITPAVPCWLRPWLRWVAAGWGDGVKRLAFCGDLYPVSDD